MGISLIRKEKIRQKNPLYGIQPIEVAHKQDKFLGGSDDDSNLEGLTKPQHLLDHVSKAMESGSWNIARRHYGAAKLIAKRMTPEQIEEANRLLATLPTTRKKE